MFKRNKATLMLFKVTKRLINIHEATCLQKNVINEIEHKINTR